MTNFNQIPIANPHIFHGIWNSGNHQKSPAGHTHVTKLTMVLVPQPGRS
jgi:hypothetical protein